MKNLSKKSFIYLMVGVLTFALVNSGCKKKDEPAPELPPQSSFLMDFTFQDQDTTSKALHTYGNWGYSAINVGVWNIVITVGMAVPVASFVESFKHQAEYNAQDEYWTWSYNFDSWGQHSAELTGYLESDSVVWEMRIDGYLWYYGHSHTNGSGGYWMLKENKTQATNLIKIYWQKNSTGVTSIKYLNVADASSTQYKNNGEYIEYGTVSSGEYDRFYHIFLKDDTDPTLTNLTDIEWNFADKHGHVKDEKHFNDTEWHCWDTNLADITCP